MCLYTKNKKPFKADRDIVCYKRLNSYFELLVSPYEKYRYHKNRMAIGKGTSDLEYTTDKSEYIITGGYIHAYINKAIAKTISSIYGELCIKCIIPKGANYYIDECHLEICASRMIIGSDINTVCYSKKDKIKNYFINIFK